MVKARGPSKGANWLARERGHIGPRFTTSCAKLFEENGDPWLSKKEQVGEFPLSHSRRGDEPLTAEQQRRADIYENARSRLEAQGVAVPKPNPIQRIPQPSLVIDPDMDMFTKAERVREKEKFVDPKPIGEVRHDHARWRANFLRRTKLAMAARTVDVPETKRKKEKNFGVGTRYLFDAPVRGKK